MIKDEFIDLFSLNEDDDENKDDDEDEDLGTLDTVIKNDDLQETDSTAHIAEEKIIESEAFTIKLYQKEDYIDKIEILCKCGRNAAINLNYSESEIVEEIPAPAHDELLDSDELPDTDPDTGEVEDVDDDTFFEGINANKIEDISAEKIIEPSSNETEMDDDIEPEA